MEASKKLDKIVNFDPKKCNDLYEALVGVFQQYQPTVGELLLAFGNCGYTLGASIEGYKDKGPSIDELKELYYKNPTLGNALMMQSVEICSWFETYNKQMTEKV